MSTLSEMNARLLAAGTPFKAVEGGLELADVIDSAPKTSPVGYLLVAKEVAAENERATGPVLQRIERDVMLVIAVKHAGSDKGAQGDKLTECVDWAKRQLLGLVPADMDEPITYIAGEIVEVRNSVAWFEMTFACPLYLTEEPA